MDLAPEGKRLADAIRYCDKAIRNARLTGIPDPMEMEILRRERAVEAIHYCKRHCINYWDFLKEVESE